MPLQTLPSRGSQASHRSGLDDATARSRNLGATAPQPGVEHDPDTLIRIFDSLFVPTHNTILRRGGGDPLYLPADDECPHNRILFAHGFFASALHEVSHWFLAGAQRRKLEDYGYWYKPDGRNQEEQMAFERVEAKNQGLEWILSVAADHPFHVSADNLNGETSDLDGFRTLIRDWALTHLRNGLPPRARRFATALKTHYGTERSFDTYWAEVDQQGILPEA